MKLCFALLLTATALTACGEEDRREFIYKPAYCLAGGLAQVGSEACLPKTLKDQAAAVADAKLKDAAADQPSEDLKVYYTDDQRLSMSYRIAQHFFAPDAALTKRSATLSLEAAGVMEPGSIKNAPCGENKARKDLINFVRDQIRDTAINRDTAQFIAEHYTDLQITELYRVADAGGKLDAVKDDAFIMPDPKAPGKTINVKPKAGTQLGGILSYTTSRVTSRIVKAEQQQLEALRDQRIAARKLEACPPAPVPVPEASPVPTEVQE